jgi:hypothetical protein
VLDVGCLPRRSLTLTGNLMSGSMPSVWSLGNLTYVRRTHTRTTDAAGWADVGWCVSVGNEEAAWGVCEVCEFVCLCVCCALQVVVTVQQLVVIQLPIGLHGSGIFAVRVLGMLWTSAQG